MKPPGMEERHPGGWRLDSSFENLIVIGLFLMRQLEPEGISVFFLP